MECPKAYIPFRILKEFLQVLQFFLFCQNLISFDIINRFLNRLVEYFNYHYNKCNGVFKPYLQSSQIWGTDHIFHFAQQCHTRDVNPWVKKNIKYNTT